MVSSSSLPPGEPQSVHDRLARLLWLRVDAPSSAYLLLRAESCARPHPRQSRNCCENRRIRNAVKRSHNMAVLWSEDPHGPFGPCRDRSGPRHIDEKGRTRISRANCPDGRLDGPVRFGRIAPVPGRHRGAYLNFRRIALADIRQREPPWKRTYQPSKRCASAATVSRRLATPAAARSSLPPPRGRKRLSAEAGRADETLFHAPVGTMNREAARGIPRRRQRTASGHPAFRVAEPVPRRLRPVPSASPTPARSAPPRAQPRPAPLRSW